MGIDIYLERSKEQQKEDVGYFRGRKDMLKWWRTRLGADEGKITAQDIAQYLIHVLTFPSDGVGYAPYDFLIPSNDCRHSEPWCTDHVAEVNNFLDPWRKALMCLQEGDDVILRLSY